MYTPPSKQPASQQASRISPLTTPLPLDHQPSLQEDGASETTLMERTLSAREYNILLKQVPQHPRHHFHHHRHQASALTPFLLKQADPDRSTVSKTLTCFTWNRYVSAARK